MLRTLMLSQRRSRFVSRRGHSLAVSRHVDVCYITKPQWRSSVSSNYELYVLTVHIMQEQRMETGRGDYRSTAAACCGVARAREMVCDPS